MVDTSMIKSRLRISHNMLDNQFAQDIEVAKAELVRVGVSDFAIESGDPLIDKAIIAYCMWIESSNEKMANGYEAQWNQWKDELRKTPEYKAQNNV